MADEASAEGAYAGATPGSIPLPPLVVEDTGATPEELESLALKLRNRGNQEGVIGTTQPGAEAQGTGLLPTTPPPGGPAGGQVPFGPPVPQGTKPGLAGPLNEGNLFSLIQQSPEIFARASSPANVRAMLRGGLGATGAAVGGSVAGLPGGVAGTFIGSYAGSTLADIYDNVYNSDASPAEKSVLLDNMAQNAKSAALDTTVSTGVGVVVPALTHFPKVIAARLLQLPPNSAELLKEAQSIGVDIGVANVPGSAGGAAINVLGRFPFLGRNVRGIARDQAKQLLAAYNDMFGRVSNAKTINEISTESLTAIQNRFTNVALGLQKRFQHAARIGVEAGPIINADGIQATAKSILDGASKAPIPNLALPGEAMTTLRRLAQMNPGTKVSTPELQALDIWAENISRKYASHAYYPQFEQLSKAIDAAYQSSTHPAAKAMWNSKQAFIGAMKDLQSEAAKKWGVDPSGRSVWSQYKVDKNAVTIDRMEEMLTNLNSVNQVKSMRDAVGDQLIKATARYRLDRAFADAIYKKGTFLGNNEGKFDADKFRQALGLDNKNGRLFSAVEEQLRGTGVTTLDLEKFARVANAVSTAPTVDASQFMARAAMLKSARNITGALKSVMTFGLVGGAAGTMHVGIPTAIAIGITVRWGLGKLMQPDLLRSLTAAMDTTIPYSARVAAITQLARNHPYLFWDAQANPARATITGTQEGASAADYSGVQP